MENRKKLNSRLAHTVLEGLKYTDLSKESLQAIHGWLTDKEKAEEKELFFQEFFNDTFDFERRPSQVAYDMLPEILERLGLDKPKAVRRPLWTKLSFRVAAAVVPFLLLAGAALLTIYRSGNADLPEPSDPVIVANATDVPETIRLACGTQIVLKPGSELQYNDNRSEREVTLSGEAFFTVTTTGEPFIVRTEDLIVTVLGTEFHVRAVENTSTEVSLLSGSVEVSEANGSVILQPMERLTYVPSTGQTDISEFHPAMAGRLKKGTLDLDGVPLSRALEQIAGFYGRSLVLESRPDDRVDVNLVLKENIPVEEILEMVQFISESFTYEITENTISIR